MNTDMNSEIQKRADKLYNTFLTNITINEKGKEMLFNKDNLDTVAKAATVLAFRNGPVEDMHADGKLSDEDMKILNKYMVNRIAYLLELIHKGQYAFLADVITHHSLYSSEWDKAEPYGEDLEKVLKMQTEDLAESAIKEEYELGLYA